MTMRPREKETMTNFEWQSPQTHARADGLLLPEVRNIVPANAPANQNPPLPIDGKTA